MNLSRGLEIAVKMKELGIVTSYLHNQFDRVESSEEAALQRNAHEDLEETTAVSRKYSFAILPGWEPSASVRNGLSAYN